MPHSRIPVRPHVLVAFCLGLGVLGMAVLGLLLVPAEHARAAQTTLDTDIKLVAQGGANLDALRRFTREYARQHRGNAPPLAAPSVSPNQADGQITGRLVAGDTGVANTSVYLRRYRPADNTDDTRVLTVTTSTTGTFVFANPPTPPSGYAYYVEFGPQTSNPNLAYFWNSRDVDNYTAGQQVNVGTLDVANTPLIAPADNATVSVPVTFQWTRRARTSDIYSLYFEDLSGNSGTSNALGYIDRIILPSLGGALRTGEPYLWGIWIDNTTFNGSFGLSQRRTLTFTDAPAQSTGTTTATAPAATGTATLSAPATTGTPTPTAAVCQSGTVQVNIENFSFVPASVTVCKGATVRWTNLDTAPHTSTSDTGVWDSGTLTTGQSFSFTFNTTGVFPYHCTIHPNMHGVINVVDAPTATATATATGTAGATGTATAQATGTPTVGATGTATAQATGTATVGATGTATTAATGTATAPAVMTGTATLSAPATTGTPTPTSTTGVCQSGTVQVNIQNFAFVPATVTVCQGATVRWTNLDSVQHTSTSDTGVWDSGLLSQGQSFSFTFNTAGTYPYHCTPHPNMRGTIIVVPAAAVTPTTTGTAPAAATGTATAQATAVMTGTPTVGATGTATAQPTAMMTGTATAQPTAMMTGTATVQATTAATGTATAAAATGTATAQATGTATVQPTGTATAAPTSTATRVATGTATAQATGTATVQPTRTPTVQPTGTATVRPTATAVSCGGGNLCAGVIVVRAFIDFGCDGFFNRGTDYPLYGSTVTATLSDGTRLVSVVDENGNALITGVNLAATGTVQVSIDSPPLPTWVQQASYGLAPCGNSPTTMTLQRSNFGLFGVAFTDFRFGLTQR